MEATKEKSRRLSSDILVGPSLPPFVEGQLRCFLHVSVGEVKWMSRIKPPSQVHISFKWWGQQSNNILLEPKSTGSYKTPKAKCAVKYPIRSGPKQFSAYLKDMGSLNLDVLANKQMIGQAQINNIGLLCNSRPLQGFYPVISVIDDSLQKEIASIFVSLAFHSVASSFNMTSSTIPTTDMSSPQPKTSRESSKQAKHYKKEKGDAISTGKIVSKKKQKEVKISSAPPEKIEYSDQSIDDNFPSFVVGPGKISSTSDQINTGPPRGSSQRDLGHYQPSPGHNADRKIHLDKKSPVSKDLDGPGLLHDLIERGKTLRNKMLLSSLDSPDQVHHDGKATSSHVEGNLIKEILHQIDDDVILNSEDHSKEEYSMDKKLVEMVTGEDELNIERLMKKLEHDSEGSLNEEFSDSEDPIREASLLTDLFYNAKLNSSEESSVVLSDDSDDGKSKPRRESFSLEDQGNKRPKKSKKQKRLHKSKSEKKGKPVDDLPGSGNSMNDEDNNSMTYINPISNASQDESTQLPEDNKDEPDNIFAKKIERLIPEGMDLDTITILARARFARVIVHKLDVKSNDIEPNNCTFFIEYEFPFHSRESTANYPAYNEVIRCASNKVVEKSVVFNHRSVFPVHFDGPTLTKWWDKRITFKVFSRGRSSASHVLIGKQSVALRRILLSDDFIYQANIDVVGESNAQKERDNAKLMDDVFGQLELSIELGSDKEDLKHKNREIIETISTQAVKHQGIVVSKKPGRETEQSKTPLIRNANLKVNQNGTTQRQLYPSEAVEKPLPCENIALHSLLLIPEGRVCTDGFESGLAKPVNAYLVCRMFWDASVAKSKVCWSTVDPEFQFVQTIPLMLNSQLLDRAKDNFMVVEIWNKSLTADDDMVIGIVKLSLHPFYLSFKDRGIVKTLLKSQYPVVAADGFIQIKNLFSGADSGRLQVLLAMGTREQIANLLKMKKGSYSKSIDAQGILQPFGDHGAEAGSEIKSAVRSEVERHSEEQRNSVDHIFVVSVENAKNLGHSKEVGNADCFVQYQFPEHKHTNKVSSPAWHKTQTTLLVENPLFGYSKKHNITIPADMPVQSFMLRSFEHHTSLKSMGIPLEVWQRSYYPNIRDCLLYKTSIPMAKIYAMITMRQEKDVSIQSFKLPLTPVNIPDNGDISHSKATLNVGISYQQSSTQKVGLMDSKGPCVCISVSILRACGLKAVLFPPKSRESRMRSLPTSGLNTFVKIWLSFLGVESCRVSPVIVRSFAPTFSFHIDFPVNVIEDFLDDADYDEDSTLAYHLENGFVEVEMFHKPLKSGFMSEKNGTSEDGASELLIGCCRVPLLALLCHNTGIKGWHPINVPRAYRQSRYQSKGKTDADEFQKMIGGLELAVKFGKETDRELVINTARGAGWSPLESIETHEESFQDFDQRGTVSLKAVWSVEKLWVPVEVIEKVHIADRENLRIYCRYKFYDKAAFTSKLVTLDETSSPDMLSADLNHLKSYLISASSALSWYLREEFIECQIWLKALSKKDNIVTNKSRDRLLGSAYIDASGIAKSSTLKGSVSGLYPMYKSGADLLGGSCVRISLRITEDGEENIEETVTSNDSIATNYPKDEESDISSIVEDVQGDKQQKRMRKRNATPAQEDERIREDITGVDCQIVIEEALHLPFETNLQGSRCPPSTFMAYQLTPFHRSVCTSIVFHSTKPCWNFKKVERLDLAKIPNQVLVFKLFKKTPSNDQKPDTSKDPVIGTTTVDISLLFTGFRQIHGWYNIVDFSGQNVGQVKVGVIPGKPVATSPSARYFCREVLADKIHGDLFWGSNPVRALDFEDIDQGQKDEWLGKKSTSKVIPSAEVQRQETNEQNPVEPSSSTSTLFHRLRDQMSDLDDLTKELRNRLKSYDQQDVKVRSEVRIPDEDIHRFLLDNLTVENNDGNDSGNKSNVVGNKNEPFRTADIDKVTIGQNMDIGDLSADYSNHPNDDPQKLSDLENNDAMLPEHKYLEDDVMNIHETLSAPEPGENANPITDHRLYDSFDDVLKDWQSYRQGTHAHDFLNSDGAISEDSFQTKQKPPSTDSPKELIVSNISDISFLSEINKFNDNQCKTKAERKNGESARLDLGNSSHIGSVENLNPEDGNSSFASEKDVEASYSEVDVLGKILNDREGDFTALFQGEPVSFSPDEKLVDNSISERDIINSDREGNDRNCDLSDKNLLASSPEQNFDQQSHSNNENRELPTKSPELPNFFMPSDMLVKSMQKYRLTKVHGSGLEDDAQAENKDEHHGFGTKEIEQEYKRRRQLYTTKETRPSLDKPPPLQTSEMNRIASIFTSKFT
ncbi:C2 domain-containing protein 3-like [Rhopilema esculentum]|uniref:C2 domain-containing protein 3-like n=1 Tax=Rhopilema esculentum TaxID=499914 RepID=UPI0031D5CFF3